MSARYFIEASDEGGAERVACDIEAGTFEDAFIQLCAFARAKWPASVWRPCAVVDVALGGSIYGATVRGEMPSPGRLSDATRRAFRAVFASLDMKLGAELKNDVLHKGTALALAMMIRDTVRALDPELADALTLPKSEEAEEAAAK